MKEEKISEPCVNLCVPCGEKSYHKAHKSIFTKDTKNELL